MKVALVAALLVMVTVLNGCVTPPPAEQASARPAARERPSELEVVTVTDANGKQVEAVLTRGDIAATIGSEPASWQSIALSRERLIETLRRTRFGSGERPGRRDYAELFLDGCLIQKRYSLADLGFNSAGELLEHFFDARDASSGDWWIRKIPSRAKTVEENGLIALVKSLGFEATRTEIAPVLFVRPPPELR